MCRRQPAGRGGGLALAFEAPIVLSLGRDELPSVNIHNPRSLAALLELVEEASGYIVAGAKLRDRERPAARVALSGPHQAGNVLRFGHGRLGSRSRHGHLS